MKAKSLKQFFITTLTSGTVLLTSHAYAIEEIVVTAQKREQNSQSIGIAITALTGDNLKELGINQPVDLAAQVPSVDIKYPRGNTNPVITIRGVGLNDDRPNSNPSAAVHFDEVFLGSAAYLSTQLFDVERVEVLKGPQGTLYGRNSTAGSINFISRAPSQDFDAYVEAGYGNYNSFNLNGAVGGGLSETVSGRFAFDHKKSDGYVTNLGNAGFENITLHPNVPPFGKVQEEDDKAGQSDVTSWRATLLYEPTDKFDATLSLHGSENDSGQNIYAVSDGENGEPFAILFPFIAFSDTDGDPHKRYDHFNPRVDSDSFGGYLKMNYDLDFATLTSISAYESLDRIATTGDGTPLAQSNLTQNDELSQFTQEIRLTSNSDTNFQWIVGAFYSDDEVDVTETSDAALLLMTDLLTDYVQSGESWAVFAHTEWQFTDALKLTTGLRYTEEEKVYQGGTTDLNTYNASCLLQGFGACFTGGTINTGGPVVFSDIRSEYDADAWTGKVGLDWQPNDDALIYASISKGFKSGGVDGSTVFSEDDLVPFDAETVWAYEAGVKLDFPEANSRVNASIFYYDYDDIQAQATVLSAVSGLQNTLRTNAGKAEVVGAEVEWTITPTDNLMIHLGASFVESEIKTWNSADPAERALFEGNELQDSPNVSLNGLVRYAIPMENGMTTELITDFNYVDETFRELENNPFYATDSYSLINARINLLSSNDDWTFSIWARNLADKEYVTSTSDSPSVGRWELPGAPRTYGITFNYRWE